MIEPPTVWDRLWWILVRLGVPLPMFLSRSSRLRFAPVELSNWLCPFSESAGRLCRFCSGVKGGGIVSAASSCLATGLSVAGLSEPPILDASEESESRLLCFWRSSLAERWIDSANFFLRCLALRMRPIFQALAFHLLKNFLAKKTARHSPIPYQHWLTTPEPRWRRLTCFLPGRLVVELSD